MGKLIFVLLKILGSKLPLGRYLNQRKPMNNLIQFSTPKLPVYIKPK